MKFVIETDSFFCLPLRVGLLAWGYIYSIVIGYYNVCLVRDIARMRWTHYDPLEICIVRALCYLFLTVWDLTDVISFVFLIVGLHKKNGNYIELCYNYLKIKVVLYAVVLAICILIPVSYLLDPWWIRNCFDTFMGFLLYEHQEVGVLAWVAHIFLMLMVNAMMLHLGHRKNFKTLWARLRNRQTEDRLTENIINSKTEEEVKEIC